MTQAVATRTQSLQWFYGGAEARARPTGAGNASACSKVGVVDRVVVGHYWDE